MLTPSRQRNAILRLLVIAVAAMWMPLCAAQDARREAMELFEKHVRPTLVDQCIRCHGPEKQQAGLRLDTREGWADGGDSGPAIIAGNPDSLLLRAIAYENPELEMPPRGKLPEQTIDAFANWVRAGAPDPRSSQPGSTPSDAPGVPTIEQGKSFWSFQPVTRPEVPSVADESWPKTDLDRFILARLEAEGLQPLEDADPLTLLRRLYYDLVGLPPTPAQIEQFLSDRSPTAYEDMVDRLLDSHHFGERWGRHWLDVVRFAESSGGGRTLLFPDAWRYRDYVIESFNQDVPYDQFVREQIAGDLLDSSDWQQQRRNLTATAFLLLGPTNYEMQDKEILEMDIVDEQLDTIGKALLGMTIGCARCHDHKFDPIPTHDYYALAGILKSTKSVIHSNVSQWNTSKLPLPPAAEHVYRQQEEKLAAAKAKLDEATRRWIDAGGKPKKKEGAASVDPKQIAGIVIDDGAAELVGQWTESTSIAPFVGEHYIHDATAEKGSKSATYRAELPAAGRYAVFASYSPASNRSTRVPFHVHHADGVTTVRVNQKQSPSDDHLFAPLGVFQFDPASDPRVVVSNEGTDDGVVIADAIVFLAETGRRTPLDRGRRDDQTPEDPELIKELKKEVNALTAEVKSIEQASPPRPLVMATADDDTVGDLHLAIRGVVHQKGPLTPRGVMRVAAWEPFPEIPTQQSGRKELADWIVHSRNPLTARVMANRVWYWLMGQGIVPTVDNFGSTGRPPTHPELLDHLAFSFTQQGWSIKQLVRRIVLSRTYRLSSRTDAASVQVDPGNRLLWRMNRKRLRAEDIRDSMLLVAGTIDFACGGPNIKEGTTSEYGYPFTSKRRSVYLPVFRNTLPEIFEVFDFADPNIQRGHRTSSTIASQALLLMNHPFVIEQSQQAAANLLDPGQRGSAHPSLCEKLDRQRIDLAHLQVLGRPPTEAEREVAVDLVGGGSENGINRDRFAMLYQVLFQCIDFRYLD